MNRILLIDDDEDYSSVVKMRLEKEGFEVTWSSGCEKAIEVLDKDFAYDLVILDVEMPQKNGLATLAHLRHHFKAPKFPNGFTIPVMVATGLQSARLEDIFASQNVSGYIKKPFESHALVDQIRKIVEAKAERT